MVGVVEAVNQALGENGSYEWSVVIHLKFLYNKSLKPKADQFS